MPSTRDIRRRIKSVKNTSQITKAMQMVASSKMQKAQQAAVRGRPFAEMANLVMDHAAEGAEDFTHPLLEEREVHKKAVIVVSTDKGLRICFVNCRGMTMGRRSLWRWGAKRRSF